MQATLTSRPGVQALCSRPCAVRRNSSRATHLRVNASLAVTSDYGWVMASVAATAGVCQWMAVRVVLARRDSGVQYPAMVAEGTDEAAMKFNCTQRAHQNTLEYLPNVLAMQLVLGLAYPVPAAIAGIVWALGRVVYALGYSTGDPAKRAPGSAISGLAYLAFIIATGVVGLRTALGMM